MDIQIESLVFSSLKGTYLQFCNDVIPDVIIAVFFLDFFCWKASVEKFTKSSYIASVKYKSRNGLITHYYLCNRSGKLQPSKCCKRLPKSQGSCKLNRSCTSSIKVLHGNFFFTTWVKTHYGHSQELQHIRLPKDDRATVASKLMIGVTPSR